MCKFSFSMPYMEKYLKYNLPLHMFFFDLSPISQVFRGSTQRFPIVGKSFEVFSTLSIFCFYNIVKCFPQICKDYHEYDIFLSALCIPYNVIFFSSYTWQGRYFAFLSLRRFLRRYTFIVVRELLISLGCEHHLRLSWKAISWYTERNHHTGKCPSLPPIIWYPVQDPTF